MSPLFALLVLGAPPCELVLEGRVLDASTGEPLPKVEVRVEGAPRARTDGQGRFRISDLCAGPVRVEARRADYQPLQRSLQPASDVELLLEPVPVTRVDDLIVEAPRPLPAQTRAATTLDGEALERARGKHLADALSDVPGVTVLRSGGTAKPILRGLSGARVLVLYDGVRHESQDWGLDHGTEIDPFSAGSLSVVKGAAGVRYGPDAIAGVLLVDPPPMLEDPGYRGELHLVGALNGLRGTIAGRVDAAPAWAEGLSLRLEGNFSKGRAMQTPDYPLDNTGIEEWNAGATAQWVRGDVSLKLSYAHNDLLNGVCTCLRNESPADLMAQLGRDRPADADLYTADYEVEHPLQAVTHDRVIARGGLDLMGLGELEATYAFQVNQRQEFDVVRSSVTGPQFDFVLRTHSLDATLEHTAIPLSTDASIAGTFGISAQLQDNVFTGLPLIPNYRSFGGGLFAIERLSVAGFEVEAGLRYDFLVRDSYLDDTAFARHLTRGTLEEDDCEDRGDVVRCPSTFHVGSVSLGVLKTLFEGLDAKLDLSSASRVPTIDEQFINGTAPSSPVLAVGDPSLGPETSWTASATLEANFSWVSAELSAYGSYVHDYIYFAPELNPDGTPVIDVLIRGAFPRFSYQPVDAVLYGGEANTKLRFEPIEVELQASLVRAKDVDNDAYLVFIPPDRAQVAVTYHPPDGGWLTDSFVSLKGSAVARQTRFEATAELAPPPPGYVLLGAAAGTLIHFEAHQVQVSLEASNLLNSRYRDYTSLLRYFADEPGRQVMLRVGATFSR